MTDFSLDNMEISSPRPGLVVMNHAAHVCAGQFCCIHSPSDHHMRDWPLNLRSDRSVLCPTHPLTPHVLVLAERLCEHGRGHPDPDALAYLYQHDIDDQEEWGIHGCCGCCAPPTPC